MGIGWLTLDVRICPGLGLGTGCANLLVANLQEKDAFFERPLAVSTSEGDGLGGQLEGDGLGLTRLQRDLREIA